MKYLALAALLIAAPALADDKGNGNGNNGNNGNGGNGNNWSLGVSLGGTAGAFNNTFSGAQGSACSDGLNAQGAGYSSSGAQALATGNGGFATLDCGCTDLQGNAFAGVASQTNSFAGGLVTGTGSAGGQTSGFAGGTAGAIGSLNFSAGFGKP